MTANDDRQFLMFHLRNCFITSDDTGLSELLVEPDVIRDAKITKDKEKGHASGNNSSEALDEQEMSVSPDILPDMDFEDRHRPLTNGRVEQTRKEKIERSKAKTLQWKSRHLELDQKTLNELFTIHEVIPPKPKSSALTALVQNYIEQSSNNPFNNYRQFDGDYHLGSPAKKILIHCTMQNKQETANVFPVNVVSTATVQQTTGLICWRYTHEGRQPPLIQDVSSYALYMAEDDGQVDADFPALDYREPISKFGFASLALVQNAAAVTEKVPDSRVGQPVYAVTHSKVDRMRSEVMSDSDNELSDALTRVSTSTEREVLITVHIPGIGPYKELFVPSSTIGEVLQKVMQKRKIPTRGRHTCVLELQSQPGVALDHTLPLTEFNTRDFYLMRQHETSRGTSMLLEADCVARSSTKSYNPLMTATFSVTMVTKLLNNQQVELAISPAAVSIQPVPGRGSIRQLFTQKATSVDIDSVIQCSLSKIKSGKSTFVIHYLTPEHTLRRFTFEASETIARAVVKTVSEILDSKAGTRVGKAPERRQSS